MSPTGKIDRLQRWADVCMEPDAGLLRECAAALDACRWRPIEELTEEDQANRNRLVFAIRHPCGTMDTADSWRCRGGAGYTHFFRLPKLEAPNA